MDPHFDPKKSSTNSIKSCGAEGKKCYFKQSYTEGSSWSAFKVRDKVFVGGEFCISTDVYLIPTYCSSLVCAQCQALGCMI